MRSYVYRIRFILSVIAVTVLPIIVTGIVLLKAAEQALLEEKEKKLVAITKQMDLALLTDFDTILREQGLENATREQQIQALNRGLAQLTDQIAQAHPGIGVGYYGKKLDAILTYGPSQDMRQHVGTPIAPNHPGRQVMSKRVQEVVVGPQVRGDIMNAMFPIERNGEVIGYAWANELMSSIDIQLAGMRQGIYSVVGIGCVVAAVASGLMVHRLEIILIEIKEGLRRLSLDLSFRMKPKTGEPGEIFEAINKMASDLQASRSHTETIIHSMESGVIALDHSGCITAWNQAASRITGLNLEQAIGRDYRELFQGETPILQALSQALEEGKTTKDAEWGPLNARGVSLYIKLGTFIWRSPMNEVLGAIIVLDDRSEWKRMEETLAQAKRLAMIGELAASIAHEVRNPLTSIKAFAQIIEEDLPADHDSREYTGIIVGEVDRLNRFADELLLFSSPNEEKHVQAHVAEVLDQTLLLIRRSAARQGILLEKVYGDEMASVLASPKLLKQVFLNILINALQAMQEGGRLMVETKVEDGNVLVSITNDGSSIAEEHLLNVFEPFFTTKQSGTGLGLAISQRIVQAYGGQILARNVEKGVQFTVVLPAKKEVV
ncbi:two-component system sensor histidine kinase AtoS [Brevibacillus ruminantium]|uniref:histidine kinase n=1 Tax=Brevibacillus ruminantium TaxID=2950604 RepID=A0ABY4WGC4_9BACL|nr:two-component system sensor histidine kinase AtoS [Brevibacillus ruminantium]USG64885.1 two-component system sensor histidine kinase AtoS [Brevibacillus ruminantium]